MKDYRDVLIAPAARSLADLPEGASVATGSIRRAAQLPGQFGALRKTCRANRMAF